MKHEWEDKHKELGGWVQATGLHLRIKVFKFWKFRVVTDVQLLTGGEYTRNLRKRLEEDQKQAKLQKK